MNYLVLIIIVTISTEITIKFNFLNLINSLIKSFSKANRLIVNKKISDHWKEKIIPKYSLIMMQNSILMLLIFLIILFMFLVASIFKDNFLSFTLSFKGLVASILFVFSYLYLKKIIQK